MAPDAFGQLRLAGGDARLFVQFRRTSRRNGFKSDQEGRPIYEPADFVKIQQPGERDCFDGPVTEAIKARFPDRYKQFLENVEQVPEGTPVQLLFPNQPHVVETMLDLRIQTVEQLAAISEHGIERLGMDGRKYVVRAQAAMEKSEALREVTKLEHVVADQADEIDVLKQSLAEQRTQIAALREMMQQQAGMQMQRAQQLFGSDNVQMAQPTLPAPYEPPPRPGIVD